MQPAVDSQNLHAFSEQWPQIFVFAPAEGTRDLFAWAVLDEVIPDETSSYTFSELRLSDPQPHKTTLKKASDGKPLGEWFIRPYAICQTPNFLRDHVAGSPSSQL
jgi:hypothetical protein